jgi:voltage-gated potassium channel
MDPPTSLQSQFDRAMTRVAENPFRGAWRVIAAVTIAVTIVGGVLVRVTDPDSIPDVAAGLWWSLQTVTTVGYGDVVPGSIAGRLTAALVMLAGLSFLAVSTAAVTNAFVEAAARRRGAHAQDIVLAEIRQLRADVEQLRAELRAAPGEGEQEEPPPARGTSL